MATTRNVIEILLTAKNQLTAPIRSAGAALQKFSGQITAISTGFLAFRQVAQDAVGVLDSIVGQTIRNAREFQAFEYRLGISASTLSELKYVAELNNVQFSQLAIGMQRMTRRVAEAAQGLGEAQGALKELGLDAKTLNELPLEQQFEAVAEALSGVKGQSDRVRLAFKLFDSEGVSLLQTMRGDADEMRRLRQEARETGAAMSGQMIQDADEAARKFMELQGALTGVKNAVAEGLLAGVAEAEIDNLTNMFKAAAVFAGKTTVITVETIGDFGESFRQAGETLGEIRDFLSGRPIREALFGKDAVAETEAMRRGFFDLRGASEDLNRAWLEFLKSAGFVARTLEETEGASADLEARMEADAAAAQKASAERKQTAIDLAATAIDLAAKEQLVLRFLEDQNASLDRQIMYYRDGAWHVREVKDEAAELARHVGITGDETSAWEQSLAAAGIQLNGIRVRLEENAEAMRKVKLEEDAAFAPSVIERFALEAQALAYYFDETLVAAVGSFADHFGDSMARAFVYTKKFHDVAKEAWKSFAASVISEINRIIARQLIAAALSIITSGSSVVKVAGAVKAAVSAAGTGYDEFGGPAMQHGGIVPGTGVGDRVLIRATPGEAVLPKELTALLLQAAGQAGAPGMAAAYSYRAPQAPSTVNIYAQTTLGGRTEALHLARMIGAYMREAGVTT